MLSLSQEVLDPPPKLGRTCQQIRGADSEEAGLKGTRWRWQKQKLLLANDCSGGGDLVWGCVCWGGVTHTPPQTLAEG